MSAHRPHLLHVSDARSDEPPHADDGRKDNTLLQNEQPPCEAPDADGQDAAAGVVTFHSDPDDRGHSRLPDSVIPYNGPRPVRHSRRAQLPAAPPATISLSVSLSVDSLSTEDEARLDLAYQLLIDLGLRRRARLAKAALQGEEQVGQDAIKERT